MGKLDKILEKISKDYKIEIKSAREAGVIERLILESPGLNYAFGGGEPLGRILYLQGPESGGKTTLATYLCMQTQKAGKAAIFLDYEHTFDTGHAEEMGLNVDEGFEIMRPNNAEDGFSIIRDLAETGEVGIIVVDSITTMASKAAVEDAFSGFSGGKTAAVISAGLKMVIPYLYNNKCTLVLLSQERANLSGGGYGPEFKGTGGYAPRFYSSWSARITRTGDILDPKTKELIGLDIRVRNTKNKVGIAKRDANLKLFFKGGISSDDEYIDYLKVLGLITQKGAYYSNETWINDTTGEVGMKVCGLEAVKTWLHENPQMYEEVKKQVNSIISGHNILDTGEQELSDEEIASGAWDEDENPN